MATRRPHVVGVFQHLSPESGGGHAGREHAAGHVLLHSETIERQITCLMQHGARSRTSGCPSASEKMATWSTTINITTISESPVMPQMSLRQLLSNGPRRNLVMWPPTEDLFREKLATPSTPQLMSTSPGKYGWLPCPPKRQKSNSKGERLFCR